MIRFELRKLTGHRLLWTALAVLLLLNCGMAYYTALQMRNSIVPAEADAFIDYYLDYPDEVETHKQDIARFHEEQMRLAREAMDLGREYELQNYPNQYGYSAIGDELLIIHTEEMVDSASSYFSDLQAVIRRASDNLAELESKGMGNSYAADYQRQVIDRYQTVLASGRQIGLEYIRGWDAYFQYTAGDILLFAFVMLLASALFLQEKQCGFWPIIRTSRRGRLTTGVAKLCAFGIVSIGALLLFAGTSFAAYGVVCGYSSPHNILQALNSFRYSTLQLTVGQYLPLYLLMKLSAVWVFGALVLLISLFFTHYAGAYACGILLFGMQYLMQSFPYINTDNPFLNLNLLKVAGAVRLTARFRTLNAFGNAIPYLVCWTILALVLLAGTCLMILLFYCKGYLSFERSSFVYRLLNKWRQRHTVAGKHRRALRSSRVRAHSLFGWSLYQRWIGDRMLPLIALLLIGKCLLAADAASAPPTFSDSVYKEYMTAFAGEWTAEKSAAISEERTYINETLAKSNAMRSDWKAGTISDESYSAYLDELNYAISHDDYLRTVEAKNEYLQRIQTKTGVTPAFVYDTGWNALFSSASDLWLYAAIFLLFCGSFAEEYRTTTSSGGFAPLMRSTVKGRSCFFQARLAAALVSVIAVSVLFCAADLYWTSVAYELPQFSAPVTSLEPLSALSPTLTIGQFLVFYFITRIGLAVFLCLLIFGLSALLHHTLPVMSLVCALTLLPHLLVQLGLPLERMDFHQYFASTPLWLSCAENLTAGLLPLTIGIIALTVLLIVEKRRYL